VRSRDGLSPRFVKAAAVRLRGNVSKRLAEVRDEVRRARETLRVLEEQLRYADEVADEAVTRALVASTPIADRERKEAQDDLRRVRRQRDDVAARIEALLAEQDSLLDRIAVPGLPAAGPAASGEDEQR
jgi:predicted  nucleic acid-binding Zn-ribbon protein